MTVPSHLLAWLGLALAGCATAARAGSSGTAGRAGALEPRVEIVQVTGRLFSAMRTRDTAALRALLLPDAALIAVRRSTRDESVRIKTLDAFLRTVADPRDTVIVRLRNPRPRVDGDLAVVSGSYDAYAGAQYTHCGYQTFHLIRQERTWRIAAITYTVALGPCA